MASEIPPWVIGVAGSSGAIVANTIVYPLDIVKTRLQVQMGKSNGKPEAKTNGTDVSAAEADGPKARHYKGTMHAIRDIIEHDGFLSMYNGLPGASLSTAGTNFVYFYAYSTLRALFSNRAGKSIVADLGLGTAAGAVVSLAISPISVVTTTQQTDLSGKGKTMLQTAKAIVNGPAGWAGLWSGIKPSLILSINPAITYGAYEQLRIALFPTAKSLKPHEAFCKSPDQRQYWMALRLTCTETQFWGRCRRLSPL